MLNFGLCFREEYLALLKKNKIEFDEKYTFEWYDEVP